MSVNSLFLQGGHWCHCASEDCCEGTLATMAAPALRAGADGGASPLPLVAMDPPVAELAMIDEDALCAAVQRGEFSFVLEPQYTAEHMITGFEAVFQWEHPQLGPLPAAEFMPTVEHLHSHYDLVLQMLDNAVGWLATSGVRGMPGASLSVALRAHELGYADLVDQLRWSCMEHGVHPRRLMLHLPWSTAVTTNAMAVATVREFAAAGFRICLDSTPASVPALGSLGERELVAIRLDCRRTIVSPGGRCLVRTARSLAAHALAYDLDVLSSNVNDEWVVDLLLAAGCRLFQGRAFGEPMDIVQAGAWLEQTVRLVRHV